MKLVSYFIGLCLASAISISVSTDAQAQAWKPVAGKISTPWAEKLDPASPLPDYPRPQLVRKNNWKNLNGLWDYAITSKEEATAPKSYQGKILVPFPVESSLSGVGKTIDKNKLLWYKTSFAIPSNIKNNILLHFGAVDWKTDVWVNGKKVGTHEGGFDPFSFDITAFVKKRWKARIGIECMGSN